MCPRLESIQIQIYFRAPADEKQPTEGPALCLAGAGLLSQASGTVRTVTIRLYDLPRVSTLNNRRLLRLQEFDKILTPKRFPLLEEVNLYITPHWILRGKSKYEWAYVVTEAQKVLPQLHSRGVLKVRGG